MNAAYLSAISAPAGSVVGGFTSGLAAWLNQRSQARAGLLAHKMARREDLYRDFIVAASKAYGQALTTSEPQIQDRIALYAMISRMRVLCAQRTIECADRIMHVTMTTYRASNKTIGEIDELIKSRVGLDPLKRFQLSRSRGTAHLYLAINLCDALSTTIAASTKVQTTILSCFTRG